MSNFRYFVATILMFAACTAPARADGDVPLGYLLMCVELPEECQAGGASSIVVTDEIENTLEQVKMIPCATKFQEVTVRNVAATARTCAS